MPEEVIDKFSLLINNKSSSSTCPASPGVSVYDLALSIVQLGPLILWEIPKEHLILSDHELILLRWEIVDAELS